MFAFTVVRSPRVSRLAAPSAADAGVFREALLRRATMPTRNKGDLDLTALKLDFADPRQLRPLGQDPRPHRSRRDAAGKSTPAPDAAEAAKALKSLHQALAETEQAPAGRTKAEPACAG